MTDSALTCERCRNSPATHLVVFDVGTKGCKAPMRVKRLDCDACAVIDGRDAAASMAFSQVFTLTPVEVMASV